MEVATASFGISSGIVERMSRRKLQTGSGSKYSLKGEMNVQVAVEHGIPEAVALQFLRGFPKNWKETIAKSRNASTSSASSELCPYLSLDDAAKSVGETIQVTVESKIRSVYIAKEDDTPEMIAARLGIDTRELVRVNTDHIQGISKSTHLYEMTQVLLPRSWQREQAIPEMDDDELVITAQDRRGTNAALLSMSAYYAKKIDWKKPTKTEQKNEKKVAINAGIVVVGNWTIEKFSQKRYKYSFEASDGETFTFFES